MKKKKTLQWGETPFDKMSREELLFEIRRMYSAIISLNSALALARWGFETHPFWRERGSGGIALEKARQILDPLHAQYKNGDDALYRAFFRYADDLLFDRSTEFAIGSGWAVCPECGVMLGDSLEGASRVGLPCREPFSLKKDCKGIFRSITWEDLSPK